MYIIITPISHWILPSTVHVFRVGGRRHWTVQEWLAVLLSDFQRSWARDLEVKNGKPSISIRAMA
jgi:hypothetical protein